MRADELAALINERPGNLFKLVTATGFVGAAVVVSARRAAASRERPAAEVTSPRPDGALLIADAIRAGEFSPADEVEAAVLRHPHWDPAHKGLEIANFRARVAAYRQLFTSGARHD
jgi:hypothetical protein